MSRLATLGCKVCVGEVIRPMDGDAWQMAYMDGMKIRYSGLAGSPTQLSIRSKTVNLVNVRKMPEALQLTLET